jgi:hypothetical protein
MRIILLFLLLPLFSFGQKDTLVVSLDDGLTSVYNKNSNNNGQVNLAFNGDNVLSLNKFKINFKLVFFFDILRSLGIDMVSPFLSSKCLLNHYNLKV